VTKRENCRYVAALVAEKVGAVSILVNNAGINRRNAITANPEAVIQDWQDVLSVNLNGVFNVTHAFLAQLRATRGRIINIASIQSFVHVRTPNSPAYTASKHGVLGFTRALAAELGKDGVRVNAIGPGLIETPLNEQVRANNPELVKIFLDHTPLGRVGKPEDIVGPACHRRDCYGRWRLPNNLKSAPSPIANFFSLRRPHRCWASAASPKVSPSSSKIMSTTRPWRPQNAARSDRLAPHLARVRHLNDKTNADHWRSA